MISARFFRIIECDKPLEAIYTDPQATLTKTVEVRLLFL